MVVRNCDPHRRRQSQVAQVFPEPNTAAAGGLIERWSSLRILFGKADAERALNGALAGRWPSPADPLSPGGFSYALIGAGGGVLVVLLHPGLRQDQD